MSIKDIMSWPVVWISPDSTIEEASKRMAISDIGDLPVCRNGKIIGMITDRDIVVRGCAKGFDPRTTLVKEVMTPGIAWCFDDDDLQKIIGRMEAKGVRRMIVINHNKKMIGVISLGDIAVRADEGLAAEALHQISDSSRSRYVSRLGNA